MKHHDFSRQIRPSWGPWSVVAWVALVTGCGPSATPQERRVVPHRVPGCDVTGNGPLVLKALGDFPEERATASVPSHETTDLDLPFALRGVEATTPPSGFVGVGYADPPDDVHFSLWSSRESCTAIDDAIPASHGGQAMTAFAQGAAVILAGLDPALGQRPQDAAFALSWDTRTGKRVGPSDMNAHRRAFATATPFALGALVAGGADPKFLPAQPVKSALVFRDGAFQEPPVALGDDARSKHGAVVLSNGETLLVGGEDERGAALSSLIAVTPTNDPPFGRARASGLGSLSAARKFPVVLRLANDRILVAGGIDDSGEAVSTLEWFAADGSACKEADCPSTRSLFALPGRAFVALPAGGALAVGIGPDANDVTRIVSDVWWITDEGVLDPLPHLTDVQLGTKKPRLVPATDGSPWLWNGLAWFRFDPWQQRFVEPSVAPLDGPSDDLPIIAADPGLMMWLQRVPGDAGETTAVRGFRHDVRGPLARDTTFVLSDPDVRHIVPDRPPGTDIKIESDGLHLANGGAIAIADATYADVTVSGKTRAATLPGVRLGAGFVVGMGSGMHSCPWPPSSGTDAGASLGRSFDVKRLGTTIQISVDKGPWNTCSGGPDGRLPVGLVGLGAAPTIVSELTVTRVAAP